MNSQPLPQSGDVIANRYRLLEPIGQGGFGTIYRAKQRPRPHEVAIKIMAYSGSQMAPEEMRQRFRREAVMASSLVHPHAVRQFDFGDGGHFFYLSMELVRGQTILERIQQQGPLSTDLVLRIARATLDVLQMAHQKDIVHRDLKPENIMLCEVDGQVDFPKVLDFGAAKTTKGQHDLTSVGIALGSPAYMPPELLMENPPCPASDLYSLALTLGEALIGEKVVPGDTPMDRARNQISPQPLRFPPALDNHPLASWLRGALAKDPADRYPSARAMLNALPHQSASGRQPDFSPEPTQIHRSTPEPPQSFEVEATSAMASTPSPPSNQPSQPRQPSQSSQPNPQNPPSQPNQSGQPTPPQAHSASEELDPHSYGSAFKRQHGGDPKPTHITEQETSETTASTRARDLEPSPEKDFKIVHTAQRRDRSEFVQPLIIGVILMIVAVYIVLAIAG